MKNVFSSMWFPEENGRNTPTTTIWCRAVWAFINRFNCIIAGLKFIVHFLLHWQTVVDLRVSTAAPPIDSTLAMFPPSAVVLAASVAAATSGSSARLRHVRLVAFGVSTSTDTLPMDFKKI